MPDESVVLHGVEKIATQRVEMQQEGELIRVSTLTHGLSDEEGAYEVPGISARPIASGNPDYLKWMADETEHPQARQP